MERIIFWACLLAASWYLFTSGIAQAVVSGNVPQPGRECRLCGPKTGHVFLSLDKDQAALPIDATIGGKRDRHPSQVALARGIVAGEVLCPADNTKARVLTNANLSLYGCPYQITKVKLLSGPFKGKSGWVMRQDVMDTPVQEVIQSGFRSSGKIYERELETCDPSERNLDSVPLRLPPRRPNYAGEF
jgi:hypothetical protein